MAELPFMKLYVGDYIMDTRHLTLAEHGAYLLLLMEYWTNGHALLDDDRRFSRLLGVSLQKWKAMRPVLEEFFITDGVVWHHKRIEVDLAQTREKVSQARNAGLASARSRGFGKNTNKNKGRGRTGVKRTLNGSANETATSQNQNITPLSPLRSADADAPPLDRSAGASAGEENTEAKSIGDIVQQMKGDRR